MYIRRRVKQTKVQYLRIRSGLFIKKGYDKKGFYTKFLAGSHTRLKKMFSHEVQKKVLSSESKIVPHSRFGKSFSLEVQKDLKKVLT